MDIPGYLLLAATGINASITAGMLSGLRIAIETHDPSFGAAMFKHSFFIWGLIPYIILGVRASTGWFTRHAAHVAVVEQANLTRIPFLITLTMASGSAYLLLFV